MSKVVKKCGVYSITNKLDGKQYWGSSNNYCKRKNDHICKLKQNKHDNIHLQRAFNRDGVDNFEFRFEMEVCPEQLLKVEQMCLDLNSNGYNIAKKADKPPICKHHLETTKKKLFLLKLGPHSIKHNNKISQSCLGKKKSLEHKQNISKGKLGNTNGKGNKGRIISPETRLKMSVAAKNRCSKLNNLIS